MSNDRDRADVTVPLPASALAGAIGRDRERLQPAVAAAAGETTTTTIALPAGTVLASRYRIERFLARGGMGAVYEAFDLELGVGVALKTVRPELAWSAAAIDRFKREIQLAREVTHPGVCRIFDLGRDEAGPHGELVFLTMELLRGPTLAEHLAAAGKLEAAEARALVAQLAEALDAAHAAGVVHRDLKPSNVILAMRGEGTRPVITDFGLARAHALDPDPVSEPASDPASLTPARPGTGFAGTPAYMAPEQLAGATIGPAADQYALGVVLFELLTGELPWEDGVPTSEPVATRGTRAEHRARPPSSGERRPSPSKLAALEPRCAAVVRRCLAERPVDRFPSARALAQALAPRRPRLRRALTWLAALALLFALALVLGVATGALRPAARPPDPCDRAAEGVLGLWDAGRREDVARAFAASGEPTAAAELARVERALDRHAARWNELQRELCRDRQARRLPAAELAGRGRCLQRRLVGARALIRQLAGPLDAATARAAADAATALEPLEPCADGPALAATAGAPVIADDALDEQLAEIEVQLDLARYAEARRAAEAAVRAATGDPRRRAAALTLLGLARLEQGEIAAAEAPLREAIRLGAPLGDDATLARCWVALVRLLYQAARFAESALIADVAEAAVLRAGSDPRLVVRLQTHLATTDAWMDRYPRAIARLEAALRDAEAAFGVHDPDVLQAMLVHVENLNDVGRSAEALALAQRARQAVEERFGKADLRWATANYLTGVALRDLDRLDEARPILEATVVAAAVLDPTHPGIFHVHHELTRCYKMGGQLELALAAAERTLTLARALPGPDHTRVAMALAELGDVLLARGALAAADARWAQAIDERRRGSSDAAWAIGRALAARGQIALARGDDVAARAHLEQAIVSLAAVPVPVYLALARARLSRALWSDRRQRQRALELARQAQPYLVRPSGERPLDLEALQAWTARLAAPP